MERELLLDAAMVAMERNDFGEFTVADVLAEAGVSTRSFYRHFSSKDELICALYRRDGEKACARLEAHVAGAGTTRAALEVWIDEILGFTFDKRRARRVSVLSSPAALKAHGMEVERQGTVRDLTVPLISIIEAGWRDGTFPDADPKADADSIAVLTFDAAGLNSHLPKKQSRTQARASVLSFALRALGAH